MFILCPIIVRFAKQSSRGEALSRSRIILNQQEITWIVHSDLGVPLWWQSNQLFRKEGDNLLNKTTQLVLTSSKPLELNPVELRR